MKKDFCFLFFYYCQRQNHINFGQTAQRSFKESGRSKKFAQKSEGRWGRSHSYFFWQNFYFPLVYSYLNRFFFVEILKIKKDLAGALQGVFCLLPHSILVNCIALAYKIFYPIYAKYIKTFIEILLRISKRNNNNDHNQTVNTNQDKVNIAKTLWRLDWLKINGTIASCWMVGWSQ